MIKKIKVAEFHGSERAEMVRYFESKEKADEDFEGRIKRMQETGLVMEYEELEQEEKLPEYERVALIYSKMDQSSRCSKITMKEVDFVSEFAL